MIKNDFGYFYKRTLEGRHLFFQMYLKSFSNLGESGPKFKILECYARECSFDFNYEFVSPRSIIIDNSNNHTVAPPSLINLDCFYVDIFWSANYTIPPTRSFSYSDQLPIS
jgi:hypothetical protein